jgi:RimJ/RimL family protein N-acetyltransferase
MTNSVDEFLAAAGDFLRARPVENTVLLTITKTLRLRGMTVYGDEPPAFGWWSGAGGGAFIRTPPRPAMLSAMPPAAAESLAAALSSTTLTGVGAPTAVTEAFAAEWHRLTGATSRVWGHQRLFRLTTLTPPAPPPGKARVAGPGDRDLLMDWTAAFQREVGEEPAGVAEFIDDKLSYGGMILWETDGEPVSMAGASRMESGMVRVQAVYTPRRHRAKGYAGAATVAVSQAALDAGATEVVLFTDLANPTSNALYRRLGYTPIQDRTIVEFSS